MSLITENNEKIEDRSAINSVAHLVPPEVLDMLGEPPLIRGENPEDYYCLFNQLAATIEPKNILEWIYTKDILDLVWEIRRWRSIKSAFFNTEMQRSGSLLIGELLDEKSGGLTADTSIDAKELVAGFIVGKRKSEKRLNKLLASNGLSQEAIISHALVSRLKDIERLDNLIASAEKRRDDLLKSIDARRLSSAKRFREASDSMIDDLAIDEKTKSSQVVQ